MSARFAQHLFGPLEVRFETTFDEEIKSSISADYSDLTNDTLALGVAQLIVRSNGPLFADFHPVLDKCRARQRVTPDTTYEERLKGYETKKVWLRDKAGPAWYEYFEATNLNPVGSYKCYRLMVEESWVEVPTCEVDDFDPGWRERTFVRSTKVAA